MTAALFSRKVPSGTPAPQWGRGGMDNLGPGNWHGPSGPRDNRPPTRRGGGGGRPPRKRWNWFAIVAVACMVAGVAVTALAYGWRP